MNHYELELKYLHMNIKYICEKLDLIECGGCGIVEAVDDLNRTTLSNDVPTTDSDIDKIRMFNKIKGIINPALDEFESFSEKINNAYHLLDKYFEDKK